MSRIVIYSTGPTCQRCRLTAEALERLGIPHEVIDVNESANTEHRHFITQVLGYKEAPVVAIDDGAAGHWSGFRPDLIDELAQSLRVCEASTHGLSEIADQIRRRQRISGETATDEECRIRVQLIDEQLTRLGIEPGERRWFTAQLVTGQVVGMWATSREQAELGISVWWEADCHWVVPDDEHKVRAEYFPSGIRTAATRDARFPLGPPRRPRDLFAPTESLLAGLEGQGSGVTLS